MECDICHTESEWLEIVGKNFVCYRCISKNRLMGLILRTKADSFRFLVRKLAVPDYQSLLRITKDDVDKYVDVKKIK